LAIISFLARVFLIFFISLWIGIGGGVVIFLLLVAVTFSGKGAERDKNY